MPEDRSIKESPLYYKLGGGDGPWIDRNSGNGRAFDVFRKRLGEPLSPEMLAGQTGWKHPVDAMRKLINVVNAWTCYEIQKAGAGRTASYRMVEKQRLSQHKY